MRHHYPCGTTVIAIAAAAAAAVIGCVFECMVCHSKGGPVLLLLLWLLLGVGFGVGEWPRRGARGNGEDVVGHLAEVLSGGAEVVGGGVEAGLTIWGFVLVVVDSGMAERLAFGFVFPLIFPFAFIPASHFRFPFCSCWP